MPKDPKTELAKIAVKIVLNSCADHYVKSRSELTHEQYWRQRCKLTGVQSFDNYLTNLINPHVEAGLTEVDVIVARAKKALGL